LRDSTEDNIEFRGNTATIRYTERTGQQRPLVRTVTLVKEVSCIALSFLGHVELGGRSPVR
jgi:hypothetical protein